MSVFDLAVGERAVITKITATGAAAGRLGSLGFISGQSVIALGFSLFKSSILVGVGSTRVALRRTVAKCVEVNLCR